MFRCNGFPIQQQSGQVGAKKLLLKREGVLVRHYSGLLCLVGKRRQQSYCLGGAMGAIRG